MGKEMGQMTLLVQRFMSYTRGYHIDCCVPMNSSLNSLIYRGWTRSWLILVDVISGQGQLEVA